MFAQQLQQAQRGQVPLHVTKRKPASGSHRAQVDTRSGTGSLLRPQIDRVRAPVLPAADDGVQLNGDPWNPPRIDFDQFCA